MPVHQATARDLNSPRLSLEQYEDLFVNAPVGIFISTPAGRFHSVNTAMAHLLGYASALDLIQDITHIPTQVYADSDDSKKVLHLLHTQSEVANYKCRFLRRDKTRVWVSITVRKVSVQDAGCFFFQGFVTDISEQKRTEEDLKRIQWMLEPQHESEENYTPEYGDLLSLNTSRFILDSVGQDVLVDIVKDFLDLLESSVAVYEANGDYALGIFSSKWCRFMDKASWRLCNTEDNRQALTCGRWLCHESCWGAAQACMEKGEPVDIECAGGIRLYAVPIRCQGKIIGTINLGYGDPPQDWSTLLKLASKYQVKINDLFQSAKCYEPRPSCLIENAKRRMETAARLIGEIVERRQVEEALRQQESFIKSTLDNLPVGVAVNSVKPEVHFSYMNDNFVKIYRITRDDLAPPNDFWEVVYPDPEYREQIKHRVLEDCASGDSNRMIWQDVPVSRPGQDLFYITAQNIILPGNEYMVSTVWDVTDRKQAEKEQEKLQSQLLQAQKMEAIGRLAGGVAHDFNNVLTTIIGNSELALLDYAQDEHLYDILEHIKEAGEKASYLTRQLLAFSRRQILQPEVLDLNELLPDISKMIRRIIGEDIELETILAPGLGLIEADPGQIEQVIMNLAVNARDAMPEGGKLTIETANADLDQSYSESHGRVVSPGQYVLLALSDTGEGMSPELQSQIFEPFFTTKEKGKGTGLGLSMVYGIIKQSSGYIWVYSEPGAGATFKIYLPRVTKDPTQGQKRKVEEEDCSGSETILVVEDDQA
ncbi:MAG: ATP-binding protein, partial [Desulfovermiculus sp.]